jgi:serine phosphatase RsbU (regulator of sigma subunit)
MTSGTLGPPDDRPPAAPAGGRLAAARHLLLGTLAGRLLAGGVTLKVLAWLVRLALGTEPLVIAVLDTLAGVALVGAIFWLLYRLALRARRRLLWRVRRKLILSYIFIGVVPALLIVSFFIVSGLILFLNVASYLVVNGFTNVTSEAAYLARVTALEIQRGPGPQGARPILEQREATLASRYPGASMALVTTAAKEPCVGGPAVGPPVGALPGIVGATRTVAPPGSAAKDQAASARVEPVAVGPWEHVDAPTPLPSWVSCAGFGGVVVEPIGGSGAAPTGAFVAAQDTPALVIVRGVGLPDAPRPTYAVIVDIPKNAGFDDHFREETTVKMGAVSVVLDDALRAALLQPRRVADGYRPGREPATPTGAKRRFPWVAFLQGTSWTDGKPISTTVNIGVHIGDLYDRLGAAQVGRGTFGSVLMVVLLIVATLFLFIEAGALVMGLALARSITGAVHELFEGTERVRQGDFSHRMEVKTGDQLGDLADSFNQMTSSIEDLLRQAEEKKRLEEELRIARDIQMSLLPRGQMVFPGMSLTALCVPAREVGGDYYDFFQLGDDRIGILIADVSGKGTSAALYMAELKGLMLSLSQTCPSPRQLMLTANRIISENLDSRSFITMTYAVVDLAARTMTWARAGHTPLIHRRDGDGAEPQVDILIPDGLVLGLRIDCGELFTRLLQEVTLSLSRGDVLVFFTDGISEAMNAESDLFGESRLAALVREHGHLPVDELRERLLREIDAFVAGAPQHDDMTMILLKFDDFVPGAIKAGFDDGRA